jgi:hypothetical protein
MISENEMIKIIKGKYYFSVNEMLEAVEWYCTSLFNETYTGKYRINTIKQYIDTHYITTPKFVERDLKMNSFAIQVNGMFVDYVTSEVIADFDSFINILSISNSNNRYQLVNIYIDSMKMKKIFDLITLSIDSWNYAKNMRSSVALAFGSKASIKPLYRNIPLMAIVNPTMSFRTNNIIRQRTQHSRDNGMINFVRLFAVKTEKE